MPTECLDELVARYQARQIPRREFVRRATQLLGSAAAAEALLARLAGIITYDDFGGWYDHVPPPVIDRWGPGGRVPALIISPHANQSFVDHTFYDTTSVLRFIETRWGFRR
ncbi:MAG TPA: alkaline phosphatase family protein [Chloroflexota bacterium]|jgi:phospholipase C|nr:alkaline phosphatase family protein [Chloroflexota bacterium]